MSRPAFVRALVDAVVVGALIGIPVGGVLVILDRLFPEAQAWPACPLPPGAFCTKVADEGVGTYWICRERVR